MPNLQNFSCKKARVKKPGMDAHCQKWIFGENQTNRRLILSKVSWVCILRRELLQGRRYRPTGLKINPLVRKR
jgi:hypothetical protein